MFLMGTIFAEFQTQAPSTRACLASSTLARNDRATLLQRAQLRGRHFGCRTGGIFLLDLLVKLARLVGLFGAIGFRQPKLGLSLAHRARGMGCQLLVELNGLSIAPAVPVLVRQGEFSQRGQILVVTAGKILQLLFRSR